MEDCSFDEYNSSEVEKNIKQLKKDKTTINSELNLIREPASLFPTKAMILDGLETLLIRYSYDLHKLEKSVQDRKYPLFNLDDESVSEEIQSDLKDSMSLASKFVYLAEEIAELKLRLDWKGARMSEGSGVGGKDMHRHSSSVKTPLTLKRKYAHGDRKGDKSSAKVQKTSVPEGYHYVSGVSRLLVPGHLFVDNQLMLYAAYKKEPATKTEDR